VIKITKFSLWVVPKYACKSKMADHRDLVKKDKLLYLSNGYTNF